MTPTFPDFVYEFPLWPDFELAARLPEGTFVRRGLSPITRFDTVIFHRDLGSGLGMAHCAVRATMLAMPADDAQINGFLSRIGSALVEAAPEAPPEAAP